MLIDSHCHLDFPDFNGEHDALVLAAAGLRRLGFGSRISLALPVDACVPAPGQGIVAVETREDDRAVRDAVLSGELPPAVAADRILAAYDS